MTPTETATVAAVPVLTIHDTCDRCETCQAYVRMVKGESMLDLCAHHYRDHAEKLLLTGWEVARDDRATLTVT